MAAGASTAPAGPAGPSKLITGAFRDDGTAQKLIKALKDRKGVITANMTQCRGFGVMETADKPGRLPPALPVRVVTVVVPAERADELFDYIRDTAELDRPGGGFMYQSALTTATAFALPEEIGDEQRTGQERRTGKDRRQKRRETGERRTGKDRRAVEGR